MIEIMRELWGEPSARAVVILMASLAGALLVQWGLRALVGVANRRTQLHLPEGTVDAVRRPAFLTVLAGGVGWAGQEAGIAAPLRYVVDGTLQSVAIGLWVFASMLLGSAALTRSASHGTPGVLQPRTLPLFDIGLKVTAVALGLYLMFLAWDIDLTAWLASAGVLGIALGFAAKDSLANLFAGVFILADGPYKLGDWIVLDDAIRGRVTHVGMRSTRLATVDDVEITVPNGMLANGRILNEVGGVRVAQRVSIPVGVGYASQVPEVRAALLSAAEGVPGVSAQPPPTTRFVAFGDSALNFTLQVWLVDPAGRERLVDVLNERILAALRAAHIQIPFPQRDVWMRHPDD